MFRSGLGLMSNAGFLIRNFCVFSKRPTIQSCAHGSLLLRPYARGDALEIQRIFKSLNHPATLSPLRMMLLNRIGEKCLIVASDGSPGVRSRLVGMNMYYVNPRDIHERTVHEGFIGVIEEMSGRGVATMMRKAAMAHFMDAGFEGISTRISLDNHASLRSATKLGFSCKEQYRDAETGEIRQYLVAMFEQPN